MAGIPRTSKTSSPRSAASRARWELSFAALHQLLAARPGGARRLPPPQRTALRLAFGAEEGRRPRPRTRTSPAPRARGPGGCWQARAAARPLLCLVDGRALARVRVGRPRFAFTARRLYETQSPIVFRVRGARAGSASLDGLPELRPSRPGRHGRRGQMLASGGPDPGAGWGPVGPAHSWPRPGGIRLALIEMARGAGPARPLTGPSPRCPSRCPSAGD